MSYFFDKGCNMKFIKECIPYIIIIIVVICIRIFLITPVRVQGTSMVPTLEDKQILLLNKWNHKYDRFQIVVLDYHGTKLVKRIVGLPKEHVSYKNEKLYINDKEVKETFKHGETGDFKLEELGYDEIPEGYYFVMGDNRMNSTDSRTIGLVSQEDIMGTTNFSIFPLNHFGTIK